MTAGELSGLCSGSDSPPDYPWVNTYSPDLRFSFRKWKYKPDSKGWCENYDYNSDYDHYDLESCLVQSKYSINLTLTICDFWLLFPGSLRLGPFPIHQMGFLISQEGLFFAPGASQC